MATVLQTILPSLLAAVLYLLLAAASVEAQNEPNLTITLIYYENIEDSLIDGSNCDQLDNKKISSCDPVFTIKLLKDGEQGEMMFQYAQDGYFSDVNNVTFAKHPDKVKNPIVLQVNLMLPGKIYLLVQVEDHDKNADNQLMAIFVHHLEVTLIGKEITKVRGNQLLTFTYQFKCPKNYYGKSCTRYCLGRDDNENGHYSCSPKSGEKVCLTGWKNPSEDCKIPSWCKWC